jgi:hypothetical protein
LRIRYWLDVSLTSEAKVKTSFPAVAIVLAADPLWPAGYSPGGIPFSNFIQ